MMSSRLKVGARAGLVQISWQVVTRAGGHQPWTDSLLRAHRAGEDLSRPVEAATPTLSRARWGGGRWAQSSPG